MRSTWARELAVTAGVLAPDGRTVVVGDASGSLHVLDGATGVPRRQIAAHPTAVLDVAIHPDGRRAASCVADGTVAIWELATGRKLHARHVGSVDVLVFSRTGALFAYPRHPLDASMRTGWLMSDALANVQPRIHPGVIIDAAFAPDGRLTTTSLGGATQIWNLDGSVATTLSQPSSVFTLAWSADGRVLVTGGFDGTIRVWDPATGAQIAIAEAHANYVTSIAFDPTGALFTTSGADHVVKLWATSPLRLVSRLGVGNDFVDHLVFDAGYLITSNPSHSDVWNTRY
jgi:WD40 repeat protein